MSPIRSRGLRLGLAALFAAQLSLASPSSAAAFNDEYVFATTKGVADASMHQALKVTLFPVTVALDTALLPFAVIAGFVD
jgi:uncharacterized protein YceK